MLVGEAQHGKTTVRQLITGATGFRGASCSDAIYETWSRLSGQGVDDLLRYPKEQIRPKLMALGDWMTGHGDFPQAVLPEVAPAAVRHFLAEGFRPEPAAFVRLNLRRGVRALDGIRRPNEFAQARDLIAEEGFNPVVVWVQTKRPIPSVKGDNFALKRADCRPDCVIDNDGLLANVATEIGPRVRDLLRAFPPTAPRQAVSLRGLAAAGAELDI